MRRRWVVALGVTIVAFAGACGRSGSSPGAIATSSTPAPSSTVNTWPGPPAPLETAHISLAAAAFVNHAKTLFPGRVGIEWVSDEGTTAEMLNIGVVGLTDGEVALWESSRTAIGPFADRVVVVETPYSYDDLLVYQALAVDALGLLPGVGTGISISGFDADAQPLILISGPVPEDVQRRVRAVVPEELLEFAGGPPLELL